MVDLPHRKLALPDRSYQAVVRSELKRMAEQAGFSGHRLGEVEIIIAEVTSNLIKYATKGGSILARPLTYPSKGMEIIAIDDGPGMSKPVKMLEDGISSGVTLGQGLGAIRRLSEGFDLYSLPKWGTILYSRFFVDRSHKSPRNVMEICALNVCKPQESVSGDCWGYVTSGRKTRVILVDGLGHGPAAHIPARQAVELFRAASQTEPAEQLKATHAELKKSRGAVATIVHIDEVNNQLLYSGVGNITMKLLSGARSKGCFSYNGIVGHIMPNVLEDHQLQWDRQTDTLVMHSDGISARWDIQKYPGILQRPGIILCAALYKDFNRDNDDSTVVVAKFVK